MKIEIFRLFLLVTIDVAYGAHDPVFTKSEVRQFLKNVECGNKRAVVRALVDGMPLQKRNAMGDGPLHLALKACNEDMAVMLIRRGVDVNAAGYKSLRPLQLAVQETMFSTNLINALVSQGDLNLVDDGGNSVLHHVVRSKRKDKPKLLAFLLKEGAKCSQDNWGCTPLHTAMIYGDDEVETLIAAFVKHGRCLDINAKDFCLHETVLHAAVQRKNLNIVKLLLSVEGIDVNETNIFKQTALQFAVLMSHQDIFMELIKAKAEVNTSDYMGYTTLHRSVTMDNTFITNILLSREADIEAVTSRGSTCLNLIVWVIGHLPRCNLMLKTLLEAGAEIPERMGEYEEPEYGGVSYLMGRIFPKSYKRVKDGRIPPDFDTYAKEIVTADFQSSILTGTLPSMVGDFQRKGMFVLYRLVRSVYENKKGARGFAYIDESKLERGKFRVMDGIVMELTDKTYMGTLSPELISDAFYTSRYWKWQLERLASNLSLAMYILNEKPEKAVAIGRKFARKYLM